MTIIAGFPLAGRGGVLLGADGEEGGSYEKASVRKIATIDCADYKCLIGGAGHGDFIDLAVQDSEVALESLALPVTLRDVRVTIEDVVTDILPLLVSTPSMRSSTTKALNSFSRESLVGLKTSGLSPTRRRPSWKN